MRFREEEKVGLKKIAGVLPVVHTPIGADGKVDLADMAREVDWLFEQDADGCCLALASDLLRLTPAERFLLGFELIEWTHGRGPVIVSVGAETAEEALEYAWEAQKAGASALMAIPPRARELNEDGLHEYFSSLVRSTDLPLIVQDASGYVGKPMRIEFQARLFEKFGPDRIMFKPEAPPLGETLDRLKAATGGKAALLEGSGGIDLVASHRRGIAGTIPGCDLLDGIVALWRALENGDRDRVATLAEPVSAIVAIQARHGLDGYLSIERHLMKERGIFRSDRPRDASAWTPDPETLREVDRIFSRLQEALKES